MREETKQDVRNCFGRRKRPILVLLVLCLSVTLFLGHHDALPMMANTRRERLRRNLQMDELSDVLDNVKLDDLDFDDDLMGMAGMAGAAAAAAVMIPVALIGSLITAITGGAVIGELLDKNLHQIPSKIEYALPAAVSLRGVSEVEEVELTEATEDFYRQVLADAFPNQLREVKVVSLREPQVTATDNIFLQLYDLITGNERNYGYEWKFTVLVGVVNRKELTLGQVIIAILNADMATYVSSYLANMQYSILSTTTATTYYDRLDD